MSIDKAILKCHPDHGASKIFCLSFQRSGTTSVGDFLESFGLARPGWSGSRANNWAELALEKRYPDLFCSKAFVDSEVFDDGPWWYPKLYEILYQYFPRANYILIERDADDWFKSMCYHSGGRNTGHTGRHCKVYKRNEDLLWMIKNLGIDPNLPNQIDITCSASHYKKIYQKHYLDCRDFFADKESRLFYSRLDSSSLFEDIRNFLNLEDKTTGHIHVNRSGDRAKKLLNDYIKRMGKPHSNRLRSYIRHLRNTAFRR